MPRPPPWQWHGPWLVYWFYAPNRTLAVYFAQVRIDVHGARLIARVDNSQEEVYLKGLNHEYNYGVSTNLPSVVLVGGECPNQLCMHSRSHCHSQNPKFTTHFNAQKHESPTINHIKGNARIYAMIFVREIHT